MGEYLALTVALGAFCMVGQRLSGTIVTAPMVFLGMGVLFSFSGMMSDLASEEALHLVAEITLIVLLFLDAAQIDVTALRRHFTWPVRMLLFGLPLCILIGTLAGWLILPGVGLIAAALLAAILAPTDAALGQPVVTNPAVPERPQRALIVESGLNDGLALPVIFMLAVAAAPAIMAPPEGWAWYGIKQVTLGPLTGGVIGYAAGRVLLWAKRTNFTSDVYEGIGALAVAGSAYLAADMVGGNGFIAAFCAGLAFGALVRGRCAFVYEFTESEGQFLSWASFFLMGVVLVPDAVAHLT